MCSTSAKREGCTTTTKRAGAGYFAFFFFAIFSILVRQCRVARRRFGVERDESTLWTNDRR